MTSLAAVAVILNAKSNACLHLSLKFSPWTHSDHIVTTRSRKACTGQLSITLVTIAVIKVNGKNGRFVVPMNLQRLCSHAGDFADEEKERKKIGIEREGDIFFWILFLLLAMLKLGLVQMKVAPDVHINLQRAAHFVKDLAQRGARMVALPECFNSPYGTSYFGKYAEQIPDGPSVKALSTMARENGVYLVGGSIPERDGNQLYNTSTVFDSDGNLIAKHRKVHLFDIDIPGQITFKESSILSAGQNITMFDTKEWGKMAVAICYDMRFPEMAQIAARKGCNVLLYPGAFNMTTGPMHWELLLRSRANDNQVFVAGIAPARDESASYVSWGHSMACDPFGRVMATVDGGQEDTVLVDIDFAIMQQVRERIPVTKQRRFDVYPDVSSSLV